MQYLAHPDEVVALLRLKYAKANAIHLPTSPDLSEDFRWCYDLLGKTSRSFAFVIQELSPELRDVICIFYLILRALDTVEDDMAVPIEQKVPILLQFHEKLYQPGWNFSCGTEHEKTLIENFNIVIGCFLSLLPKYQPILKDITKRMGAGMAEFSQRPVVTHKDYDLYCHYVAGLVGIGLSNLFAICGSESQWFASADEASNSMGLLLQKTNITRDYLEDIDQVPPRIFWPKDIWSNRYTDKLDNLKKPEYANKAVYCLNDMITDAIAHVPACLDYMSRLKEKRIFNFCAIPQVMAIATLSLCYNNYNVFTGVVKIRRGQTAKIMLDIYERGQQAVYEYFYNFSNAIASKIDPKDPNADITLQRVNHIRAICTPHVSAAPPGFGVGDVVAAAAIAAGSAYLVSRHNGRIFSKL
jgi:farnesyl-diphosphate farnesyltransferase